MWLSSGIVNKGLRTKFHLDEQYLGSKVSSNHTEMIAAGEGTSAAKAAHTADVTPKKKV